MLIILLSDFLYSKNFIDFSYGWGDEDINKYSILYLTDISSSVFGGIGYRCYDYDGVTRVNSITLPLNWTKKNYLVSIRPFYYFKKDNFSLTGVQSGLRFISGSSEVSTTYSVFLSYLSKKYFTNKYSSWYISSSIEKNFYDEFFIILKSGLNISKNLNTPQLYFDNSDISFYNYLGVINNTLYSDMSLVFSRSFKPDFNSHLYFGFERINIYKDNINSYIMGLKTYLNEEESYFMDFEYNYADYKKNNNLGFYKISLGVSF